MINAAPVSEHSSFADRLRNAGIRPGDSEQVQLNKTLLVFATGLFSFGSMAWLGMYWLLGPKMPIDGALLFELALVGNLLLYIKTGHFGFFRASQLMLFMVAPFAMQWAIGSFISASGVVLWGLLGPIGAILCYGVRGSAVWFVAWVVFTACSVYFDSYPDVQYSTPPLVSIRTSVIFFALNFIAVATLIYTLLRFSILEQQRAQRALEQAHTMLKTEQERSEKLLLNTLPGPIAARLKNSNETIADGYGNATVMFADIVDFTAVAAGMRPLQVFSMLNRIFSAFDELTEKHKLEKIKTIGDAYMVAGGINGNTEDHTAAMANLAIAMRDLLERDFFVNASRLQMRIGIATGPVIAGVVGKNRFIYDLWGDTVNLAARITSEGTPGVIHCDTLTQKLLRNRYEFDEPVMMKLKGKGEMQAYRLRGKKAAKQQISA